MPSTLNNDIFLHIVDIIAAEWRKASEPETYVFRGAYEYGMNIGPKTRLLRLRQTCKFLAAKITPLFFSNILINRIDVENARRLNCLMNSTYIPPAVMSYTLRPEIVHTAPGKSPVDVGYPNIELQVEESGLFIQYAQLLNLVYGITMAISIAAVVQSLATVNSKLNMRCAGLSRRIGTNSNTFYTQIMENFYTLSEAACNGYSGHLHKPPPFIARSS